MKELCTFINKEKDAAGNINLIYKCPNTACKETEGKLRVKDKSGLGNIFNHLQTCLCGSHNESSKQELEKISSRFLNEATRTDKMLYDVLLATKTLQEGLIKLSDCREVLEEAVKDGEDDPTSHWYESRRINHPTFYNGVIKIQNGLRKKELMLNVCWLEAPTAQ